MVCRFLIVSLMMLQMPMAQAGMLGAEQVAASAGAQADRNALTAALTRADVAGQLQSLGVDPKLARERVAAMTDNEAHQLAGKLESLPAGAISHSWGWVLLIVIGLVVYFNWK
jgi:hypothetical protein